MRVSVKCVGEMIEVGTDAKGQARILIHSTESELKKLVPLPIYRVAKITFEFDTDKITARKGLLWRNGNEMIPLPEADKIAEEHGFRCAEEMVRALSEPRKAGL